MATLNMGFLATNVTTAHSAMQFPSSPPEINAPFNYTPSSFTNRLVVMMCTIPFYKGKLSLDGILMEITVDIDKIL